MLEKLLKRTARYCEEEGLISPGMGVLVACSGGADSLSLLDILVRLSRLSRYDFHVEAAHFEHGIRRENGASLADARFVEEFCQQRQIPCWVGHGDVPARAAAQGLSLETAAREMRYGFLEEVRKERGLEVIATAHQADDQAETVLMRLLRGTGVEGLSAMRPRGRGRLPLIRPLLFATRREIEEYCAARGLEPRQDATNAETDCTRNRLRLVTLPQLAAEYNPRLSQALCQLAAISADETDFIARQAEAVWPGLVAGRRLLVMPFRQLHPVLQRVALRRFWQLCTGSGKDLPFAHVERLRSVLLRGHAGSQQELPHGWLFSLQRTDKVLFAIMAERKK